MMLQSYTVPESQSAPANSEHSAQLLHTQRKLLQQENIAITVQFVVDVSHKNNNIIGYVSSTIVTCFRYPYDRLGLVNRYERMKLFSTGVGRMHRAEIIYFPTESRVTFIAVLQDRINHVKQILHSPKDFFRVDGGGRLIVSNLQQCIKSALNLAAFDWRRRAMLCKEFVKLSIIECFASRVYQVSINMLVNITQRIELHSEIVAQTVLHGRGALVKIRDICASIDPAHLDRLFKPNFTTKPVYRSTGLCFPLSYGIIKDHWGRIQATRELCNGTRFSKWWPLKQKSTVDQESAR